MSAIVGLGLVPWMARGVVMSGYPLFPSVVAAFPVDWRVPAEAAHGEAEFIRVWPCSPWQGLRDPAWLWAFLKSAGWTGLELRIPATIAIAAAAALLPASWVRRRRAQQTQVPAVILIPTAAALVFWFVMAPRPRFAGAALWLLAVQLALLVVDRACPPRRRTGALAACAASLAGACAFLLTSPSLVSGLSEFGIHSPPRLTTVHLTSGLTVNVPDHEMCWDAPLPCSPFVNPALRLRREGDPASGFRLDPSVQDIDDDLIDPAVRTRRPQ